MAITNITYTDILTTDMRDADGKVLKVLKLETMEGTYESGGVIFDPAYFGLRKNRLCFHPGFYFYCIIW